MNLTTTLYFGLHLDETAYPKATDRGAATDTGTYYCGPMSLLQLIEKQLGTADHPSNNNYLRVEQYRQSLQKHIALHPDSFYAKSFEADSLATAGALLSRRDELLLSGWDFNTNSEGNAGGLPLGSGLPERLRTLAQIESLRRQEGDQLAPGFAERMVRVIEAVAHQEAMFDTIYLNEPLELMPVGLQRLFGVFQGKDIQVHRRESSPIPPSKGGQINVKSTPQPPPKGETTASELTLFSEIQTDNLHSSGTQSDTSGSGEAQPSISPSGGGWGEDSRTTISRKTDLNTFKNILTKKEKPPKQELQADGSLLILKASRETDAAAWLAKFFKENTDFKPLCVIPEKNRALDNALIQEGLPSMGILSASSARPMLQILKLVTAFLWRPIDPYKIMEFVSLAVKPLDDRLAMIIAEVVAETPGLRSDKWFARVQGYFEELEEAAKTGDRIDVDAVRREYEFWFERRRFDVDKTVHRDEVIKVFDYVSRWAKKRYEDDGSSQSSLLVLGEQAKRIRELLMSLPDGDTQLTNLRLERIVRTIYEPSPVCFREAEVGHLPYIDKPAAVIGDVADVLWWNFADIERSPAFERWYQDEFDWLEGVDIELDRVDKENKCMLWQRRRPILHSAERLWLVMPETVDGKPMQPHPLFGDLKAAFSDIEKITFDVDDEGTLAALEAFVLPKKIPLTMREPGHTKAYFDFEEIERLERRETESFTSLDSLFYYPYQWVFKHKIKLHKSSILSVARENRLKGTLGHRVFEAMFGEDVLAWKKADVDAWMDENLQRFLEQEGAVLLMYGREPERVSFENTMKFAAWGLVSMIQQNGWTSYETEQDLRGKFMNIPVTGRADLVLKKASGEMAIVDLKWRGASRCAALIRNEEDLQLVMYSRLLTEDDNWAHTAYFIIEDGKMVARNNLAFEEAEVPVQDANHVEVHQRIWSKMRNTYTWRMKQLKEGKVEVRTEQNRHEFTEEELRVSELMDMLEMKDADAPFDDYQVLIQPIR